MELTREIQLTKGQVAVVDAADFEWLSQWKWFATRGRDTSPYYAERYRSIRMHRVIMGVAKGELVDHINGNSLDNRRCNLRKCTIAENSANQKLRSNSRTGFKGVTCTPYGRWRAQISSAGKTTHLGYFDTAEDAHAAYNEAAPKHFGEFARSDRILSIIAAHKGGE